MPTKISQNTAKTFIDQYHSACTDMGEKADEVVKYLEIDFSAIQEIFAAAQSASIQCEKLRIYLAKKTPYDSTTHYPKFCSKDDYNLVLVGVDDKGSNILSTFEIHDQLAPVAGAPDGKDF